jgi:hypothetical protein
MKLYKQLIVLPVIAFSVMACMQGNKSEKAITEAQVSIKQQPLLSLNDTTLKKVVKTDSEWKKLLTDNQYYLFKMNLIVITTKATIFALPVNCLCIPLRRSLSPVRAGLVFMLQ